MGHSFLCFFSLFFYRSIVDLQCCINFFFFNFNFIFWLHCVFVASRAFSSCGERGLLFVSVHGLLIEVASLVVEHGL